MVRKSQSIMIKGEFRTLSNINDGAKSCHLYCVKCVQIRSFFWSVFSRITSLLHISPYSVRMRENADQKKLRIGTLFTILLKSSIIFDRVLNTPLTMTISRYWEIISNKTKNLFRTWKIKQRKLLLSNKDLKTWIFVKNTMDVLYKLYKWYQIVQRVSFRRGISYFIKIIPCTSMLSQ